MEAMVMEAIRQQQATVSVHVLNSLKHSTLLGLVKHIGLRHAMNYTCA